MSNIYGIQVKYTIPRSVNNFATSFKLNYSFSTFSTKNCRSAPVTSPVCPPVIKGRARYKYISFLVVSPAEEREQLFKIDLF
jgi:hypothetical protein